MELGKFIKTMQPSYEDLNDILTLHGGSTFTDMKYDGYRVQIHKGNETKIFTRNGNELNYQCYPEIMKIVEQLPKCIIDAELVGKGSTHKEVFDNVKKRFRRQGIKQTTIDKYLQSDVVSQVPLQLKAFDTLFYNGSWTAILPLHERRLYTEKFDFNGIQPSETQLISSQEQLEGLLQDTFKNKQEGRVCKKPFSIYKSGKGSDWVKFKRYEPLDLVVVGFYKESNSNGKPFTSVLCATYNDDTGFYETIGKIGVTRNGFASEIESEVKGKTSSERPSTVVFSDKLDKKSFSKYIPHSYINPENSVVLEIKAMNLNYNPNWHSCGLEDGNAFSMRIGFMEQLRYDKNPWQATTTSAVKKIYSLETKNE